MIRTLGELLQTLRTAEAARLAEIEVSHAPTIGAMYEGLTQDILNRAVPPGLDLRVVTGFAVDGLGGTTGQLDCMLVRGSGTPVPYVRDTFQWHIRDVLAVLEVKKTLFGSQLSEAYDQLRQVTQISSSWLQSARGDTTFNLRASMRAYAECTGEVAPAPDEWAAMDPAKHLILHTIMADQIAPVRIMLGYEGYSTEGGLRRGFEGLIGDNLQTLGYGPPALPNLIVAGGASLVKLSGHPYHHPLRKDGYWPIVASSHVNPTVLLLEAIWTRMSYLRPMPELFGEDLELERLSPFVDAKPVHSGAQWGWMYRTTAMSAKHLAEGPDALKWEPVELDLEQFVVIDQLCRDVEVNITDADLIAFLAKAGKDINSFARSLIDTNLVALNGERLELVTYECATVILPDGRFIAAENNTGRLTRWIQRFSLRRAADQGQQGDN